MSYGFNRFAGYSLLQTSVAVAIMAAAMAILIPRLDVLIDDSRRVQVQAVGAALQTSVFIVREQWRSKVGYRESTPFQLSLQGWPLGLRHDVASAFDDQVIDVERCVGLWKTLLEDDSPTLTTGDDPSADFRAEVVDNQCRYFHQASADARFIDYNTKDGQVSWHLN
ncbi:hypothetical protein [Thalassolituus oleivorans]|jgi:hypothetical protein|uniref:hypothetical protein n=1 Tax=Thalassolituus oleivorans TaxID=187493 RepID=UPI00042DCEC5|nr:hypothetical protein [Thalassolituus oleivorans]AHK17284.1 hypothetical protein R615_02840 [Thalassolituus oleivorans R6-15]